MMERLSRFSPVTSRHRQLCRLAVIAAVCFLVPTVFIGVMAGVPGCDENGSVCTVSNTEGLRSDVTALCGEYSPRSYTSSSNLNRCADRIERRFLAAGGRPTNQYYQAGGRMFRNVSVSFGSASGDRVVVGAHYDTCGDTPGADDNASGVAGLLALAELLGKHAPSGPVELVAYCTEEPPFFGGTEMGSAQHAMMLRRDGVNVRVMIALEMIGFFCDEPGSQRYPLPMFRLYYPSKGNYISVVGYWGQRQLVRNIRSAMRGATDLPVYSINAPSFVPGVDLSDHRNYRKQGWPAVMVTDTAFYRNPNYHRIGDRPETLDYGRMAKVVTGVFAAVRMLAEGQGL
jgi:hypothetical protein